MRYVALFTVIPVSFTAGCNTIVLYDDIETMELLQNVFDAAHYYTYNEETEIYDIYDGSRASIGYAFYAEGMGEEVMTSDGGKIAGPIVILVGIKNDKETINNIYVTENNESPLFWKLLITENYLAQFAGLKIDDAYFRRDGGKIDCITGATLSSASVLSIVREAAIEKIPMID
jgi:Na+-translocating ferredoxin:NAD+ oxidoreductase RnfG subunit